ncbi:hypothetical protein [Isoalcanivorax indicus]|uniref:hypothetical protein n=1 Tax=Isoalcanivorax indicus TaxID=2202653 RepID=UPI0013C446C2|nr:hypothetical protein [Isoalcanivorax indicus]
MSEDSFMKKNAGAKKTRNIMGCAGIALLTALLAACGGSSGGGGEKGTALISGQAASGTIREDQWRYYYYDLPAEHDAARITLSVSSGDVEMLLSEQRFPDWAMYDNDDEDCYDWAEPGQDGVCEAEEGLDPGRYYIGLVGWDPVSSYSLTAESWASATALSHPVSMSGEEIQDQHQLRLRIANLYLKSLRGNDMKPREWLPDEMPESGMVVDARGGEKYRFYFGTDAVSPAVLSVDLNGHWHHFYSMEQFLEALGMTQQ